MSFDTELAKNNLASALEEFNNINVLGPDDNGGMVFDIELDDYEFRVTSIIEEFNGVGSFQLILPYFRSAEGLSQAKKFELLFRANQLKYCNLLIDDEERLVLGLSAIIPDEGCFTEAYLNALLKTLFEIGGSIVELLDELREEQQD